ncbi:DNA-binding transcriptional LysR family regulator [Kribbella orskensis]|uniref:DNA-binding transcriptional LysR family regulator n=1 Tax=Kribbella orskensis TaxID=2512216 RepID=A0ABY2BM56_9ACTN|nr:MULTISPECIES: LysR family transcriptional regulator [Kribbella]TCN41629.1 DNA-binding transcriptional LysR family regulator [Kribbella sp. VKM Ac-2500]TCO25507.1 DNA-binding transcriptional LysR family regulator [Kribbella orskensis]
MDTRLLHTFTTLARTESFTAAAAELHLAQSTVTVQIRTLEKELGTRLFDRLARGTVITEAGRRLLDQAEGVLDAELRLRTAAATAGPPCGRVVVGAGETLCAARLPGVIADLRRIHPDVEVDLEAAGTSAAVEGLRTGRLDIALLLEERANFPDIVAERIAHEELVLVCAPEHPLARRDKPASWGELAREAFFLHEQGCSYSDRLARDLLSVPGARTRLTRFGSIEATRSCVAAGLGLTLLPRATVESLLREGRLAIVAGPRIPDVPVQLARHRRRWGSQAAHAVVDELVRHFSLTTTSNGTVFQ